MQIIGIVMIVALVGVILSMVYVADKIDRAFRREDRYE